MLGGGTSPWKETWRCLWREQREHCSAISKNTHQRDQDWPPTLGEVKNETSWNTTSPTPNHTCQGWTEDIPNKHLEAFINLLLVTQEEQTKGDSLNDRCNEKNIQALSIVSDKGYGDVKCSRMGYGHLL